MSLFEALPEDDPGTARRDGVPFKRLFVFQGAHETPSGPRWQGLLDRFLAHTLKGAHNGVAKDPAVLTQGRSASDPSLGWRQQATWPPRATGQVELFLRRRDAGGKLGRRPGGALPSASYLDDSSQTEEGSRQAPEAESNWLYYRSRPLSHDVRLAGTPRLRARISVDRGHAHLTPVLLDVAPDGTASTVSRGFLNLLYRRGLRREVELPVGERVSVTATFKPQDQRLEAGHRFGLLVQSSNTAWAVPDEAGAGVTVHRGAGGRASRVTLPLVDPPKRAGGLFDRSR